MGIAICSALIIPLTYIPMLKGYGARFREFADEKCTAAEPNGNSVGLPLDPMIIIEQ